MNHYLYIHNSDNEHLKSSKLGFQSLAEMRQLGVISPMPTYGVGRIDKEDGKKEKVSIREKGRNSRNTDGTSTNEEDENEDEEEMKCVALWREEVIVTLMKPWCLL